MLDAYRIWLLVVFDVYPNDCLHWWSELLNRLPGVDPHAKQIGGHWIDEEMWDGLNPDQQKHIKAVSKRRRQKARRQRASGSADAYIEEAIDDLDKELRDAETDDSDRVNKHDDQYDSVEKHSKHCDKFDRADKHDKYDRVDKYAVADTTRTLKHDKHTQYDRDRGDKRDKHARDDKHGKYDRDRGDKHVKYDRDDKHGKYDSDRARGRPRIDLVRLVWPNWRPHSRQLCFHR